MTNQDVTNWLSKYSAYEAEFEIYCDLIERVQTRTNRLTSQYGPYIRGSGFGGQEETWIDCIEEKDEAMKELTKLLVDIKNNLIQMNTTLFKLENPVEIKVLLYRYMGNFTIRQIGYKLNFEERHVYRIQEKALNNLREILEMEKKEIEE